ncbi:MAG TPA: hypothetical protein VFJ82_17065, partial [Longimicrobium sp.]|nr:hypothetical protein [Longimicrobium sp.]
MRADHPRPTLEPAAPTPAPAAAPRRARLRALPRDSMAAPEVPTAVRPQEVPIGADLDHPSL